MEPLDPAPKVHDGLLEIACAGEPILDLRRAPGGLMRDRLPIARPMTATEPQGERIVEYLAATRDALAAEAGPG